MDEKWKAGGYGAWRKEGIGNSIGKSSLRTDWIAINDQEKLRGVDDSDNLQNNVTSLADQAARRAYLHWIQTPSLLHENIDAAYLIRTHKRLLPVTTVPDRYLSEFIDLLGKKKPHVSSQHYTTKTITKILNLLIASYDKERSHRLNTLKLSSDDYTDDQLREGDASDDADANIWIHTTTSGRLSGWAHISSFNKHVESTMRAFLVLHPPSYYTNDNNSNSTENPDVWTLKDVELIYDHHHMLAAITERSRPWMIHGDTHTFGGRDGRKKYNGSWDKWVKGTWNQHFASATLRASIYDRVAERAIIKAEQRTDPTALDHQAMAATDNTVRLGTDLTEHIKNLITTTGTIWGERTLLLDATDPHAIQTEQDRVNTEHNKLTKTIQYLLSFVIKRWLMDEGDVIKQQAIVSALSVSKAKFNLGHLIVDKFASFDNAGDANITVKKVPLDKKDEKADVMYTENRDVELQMTSPVAVNSVIPVDSELLKAAVAILAIGASTILGTGYLVYHALTVARASDKEAATAQKLLARRLIASLTQSVQHGEGLLNSKLATISSTLTNIQGAHSLQYKKMRLKYMLNNRYYEGDPKLTKKTMDINNDEPSISPSDICIKLLREGDED